MNQSAKLAPPLLIAGAPRSGTSLSAEAFRACGVWVGKVSSLCENLEIKRVLKTLLRKGGMDPLALQSWEDVGGDSVKLRAEVERIVRRQGYEGGPWLFKDVKLVFARRVWSRAFPDATWATVWRPVREILASMERWELAESTRFDGGRVIAEHWSRAGKIRGAVRLVPRDLLDGDDSRYRAAAERIGVAWDPAAVERVIDRDRFREEL